MKNASLNSSRSWAIAGVCSFINFLQLGIARLSGLLYLSAITRYNTDRSHASLPFVLCYTVRNVSGPFVGYLGKRFGVQAVIICGCFISFLGIGACFFAEDITAVTALWGGVYGLGFGMSTILIPEVLNQHFDKYLSNANGIAFGGECVAGFALPVLVEYLLDKYGTSGSFLILSGLILHSVPAALLLKPPIYTRESRTVARQTYGKDNPKGGNGLCNQCFDSERSASVTDHNPNLEKAKQTVDVTSGLGRIRRACKLHGHKSQDRRTLSVASSDSESVSLVRNSKDFNDSKSFCGIGNPNNQDTRTSSKVDSSDSSSDTNQQQTSNVFRVFLDPPFLFILLTQSSMIFIGTMINTIVVEFATDNGVTDGKEVYVLMCLSIADMIGRFGLGWVTDGGFMTNAAYSVTCYACIGIIMISMVFIRGFAMVTCAVFLFGLFLGGLLIVCPGMVSDYIEKDKVTMALASRFVLYAPMSLTQSSLIGFFRGSRGSYNGIFYILAVICLLCCIMSFLTPYATRCRRKRRDKNDMNIP